MHAGFHGRGQRHVLRYVLGMRSGARCRGSTCVEIAILLGVIGALIVFVTAVGLRKIEVAQGMHDVGRMCR